MFFKCGTPSHAVKEENEQFVFQTTKHSSKWNCFIRKGSLNKTMENLSFRQEKLWFSVVYFSKEKANLEQVTDSQMEDLPSEPKYWKETVVTFTEIKLPKALAIKMPLVSYVI